jgi:hypothetical protein
VTDPAQQLLDPPDDPAPDVVRLDARRVRADELGRRVDERAPPADRSEVVAVTPASSTMRWMPTAWMPSA